jgi:hypothetical protein
MSSTTSPSPEDKPVGLVRFGAIDQWYFDNAPHPAAAATMAPNWLRETAVYGTEGRGSAPTVKRCSPTRDSLMSGYILRLPVDVNFRRASGGRVFVTSAPRRVLSAVGTFDREQLGRYPVPPGFDTNCAYKWINPWTIHTPRGVSVLITHPEGFGVDMFRTFSAIVDSDSWRSPTNIAFLLRETFDGTIASGTPIARVVPFLRQSWTSEVFVEDQEELLIRDQVFKTEWEQGYQHQHRQQKVFR